MRSLRKRLLVTKPTLSQILTMLIAFLALFLIFNLGQKWLICRDVLAQKQVLASQVEMERSRVEELEAKLAESQSDAYVERVFREDFGWVRDNETSAILLYEELPQAAGGDGSPPEAEPADTAPYWTEWAQAFLAP